MSDARDSVRILYFLKLGTIGFGGPAALVGYMRQDLGDHGQRIDERTYNLSLLAALFILAGLLVMVQRAWPGTVVEDWNAVPAPSQQLAQARDAIYTHVERLVEELIQGTHLQGALSSRTE